MEQTNKILRGNYNKRKHGAKKRKLEFSLTFEQYKELRKITTCFYTGISLTFSSSLQPNSWTLDRVDNNLGYIPGNVVVCSYVANLEKSRSIDTNRSTNPQVLQQITDKLKHQPSVVIKKQPKIVRIWKILWE